MGERTKGRHEHPDLHPICDRCFDFIDPWSMSRDEKFDEEKCCFCGKMTKSGVYVRKGPWDPKCGSGVKA